MDAPVSNNTLPAAIQPVAAGMSPLRFPTATVQHVHRLFPVYFPITHA